MASCSSVAPWANGLGNLVSRIMTMATNYEVRLSEENLNVKYFTEPVKDLENFDINDFVNKVWANLKNLDEDIQREEPFKKIKIDPEGAKSDVMYLLKDLYKNALALEPILPETSKKIQTLIRENKKPDQWFGRGGAQDEKNIQLLGCPSGSASQKCCHAALSEVRSLVEAW